jgi:ketosteroid isomerase-like protein
MPRDNVEVIRTGYQALTEGNLDGVLETFDPEIELWTSGAFPDFEPVYRGYDGIRAFWDAISAPWESFHLEAERIVAGPDCAAVAIHFRVRGAGSGAATELRQGHAFWFRNDLTVKISTHSSFDEALDATGLRESPRGS